MFTHPCLRDGAHGATWSMIDRSRSRTLTILRCIFLVGNVGVICYVGNGLSQLSLIAFDRQLSQLDQKSSPHLDPGGTCVALMIL